MISKILQKQKFTIEDFPTLISTEAQTHLEKMAVLAHTRTVQRFGRVMQLFIPLYLSNVCYNKCTYCGFSMEHKIDRVILNDDQILNEAKILKDKGFQHILLLTGEAPGKVDVDYIENAIKLLRPQFSSIGIEVQPFNQKEYTRFIEAGADSLTLYQETYHEPSYAKYHLAGKKKDSQNRLNAADEGGKAGFYRMNIGALLGLYDFRYEAVALANHLYDLTKKYWQTKFSVSFPRIQDMCGDFKLDYPVSDAELVQLMCAIRLHLF